MGVRASYLPDSAGREPLDHVPEMSRRARAIPVYAALRSLGRSGLAELVERNCALARRLAGAMRDVDGVEILNDVVLNQVLLRFDDDDATTRAVVDAGPARRRGVAGRDGLARPGRRARVGLELVDHRGRHRPPGRGARRPPRRSLRPRWPPPTSPTRGSPTPARPASNGRTGRCPSCARSASASPREKPLDGMVVGACLHVTSETANLVRTLAAGGADVAALRLQPVRHPGRRRRRAGRHRHRGARRPRRRRRGLGGARGRRGRARAADHARRRRRPADRASTSPVPTCSTACSAAPRRPPPGSCGCARCTPRASSPAR